MGLASRVLKRDGGKAGGRVTGSIVPWRRDLHWLGAGVAQDDVSDGGRGTYARGERSVGIGRRRRWERCGT